MNIIEK
jgi:hypothetical protein